MMMELPTHILWYMSCQTQEAMHDVAGAETNYVGF